MDQNLNDLNSVRFRKSFSKIPPILQTPHLLDVQLKSYREFLQMDVEYDKLSNQGIQRAFNLVFPIEDYNGKASLEYVKYRFEKPKHEPLECRLKGYTYVAPLYVTFRLVIWETPEDSNEDKTIRDVKEQEVYFGEIPLMTENGAFIVNGTERVIVNQLHRSPGVFFDQVAAKDTTTGRSTYSARIVPQDGRWLDFEFDAKDLLQVRIDRKKRFPSTVLLKALGLSNKEIMYYYYPTETVYLDGEDAEKSVDPELLTYQRSTMDIHDPKTSKVVMKKGRRFVKNLIERLISLGISKIPILPTDIIGRISADELKDANDEIILNFNEEIDEEKLNLIKSSGVKEFKVFFIDNISVVSSLRNTILVDKVNSTEEAIIDIYKKFRPTDPPTYNVAETFFNNMFFNPDTYRLSQVGRLKINYKLNHGITEETMTLTKEDILESVKYILNLRGGRGTTDDIDHLGNRRVRTVGELVEDRFYHGLERLARSVKEKMGYQAVENLMPSELVIPKTVISVVKEFFTTGQLSQFMDQTNPLSEITHKRRLSALGPGGLTRERAGFEVRDVLPRQLH